MKKLITAMALLLCMQATAQIKSAKLSASGLTCSMCSKAIYKALSAVPFIKSVDVDIDKSDYNLQFKDGEKVVIDDIKKAVTGAGFSIAKLKITANIGNAEVFDDAHVNIGGSTFHFVHVGRQNLKGDVSLTILDKNYTSKAEYSKYHAFTKMKCYETGYMGSCCPKDKSLENRIYHVTL